MGGLRERERHRSNGSHYSCRLSAPEDLQVDGVKEPLCGSGSDGYQLNAECGPRYVLRPGRDQSMIGVEAEADTFLRTINEIVSNLQHDVKRTD